MRIVHINDKLDISGGVEVSIRDLVRESRARGIEAHWVALKREGHDVMVRGQDKALDWRGPVSELGRSPLASLIDADTVLHVHSLSEPAILCALFDIGRVVRHIRDQRMFCPGQGKFWAASETICTRPYGLHCLLHAYTQRCCNRHPKRLLHQFMNTRFEVEEASARYAMMIANSRYTKDEAVRVGIPADKIRVLSNFTDVTPEPDWTALQPPVIAFAGRLSRTKGVHVLLDAFAKVLRVLPEARLEILGSGADEQVFFHQAEALGLGDVVDFFGWADKATIDAHLSRAAVVAFPSIYPEAFGITGIEAMMRGKPVVAFDVGGVGDWLRHEETGYAVRVNDSDAYAKALEKLLSDAVLARSMGQRARIDAMARFTAKTQVSALCDIYERALQ